MKLQCEHLTKIYSGKEVLKDVSLTLEPGRQYRLVGAAGSGKTTLLTILAGVNPATRGTVTLDGCPIWENRKALENICFPRGIALTQGSGAADIRFRDFLRAAAKCYPKWDNDMESLLEKEMHLEHKAKLGEFSDRERAMATVLTAMCSKAAFTMLDIPLFEDSLCTNDKFKTMLKRECEEEGRSFILSLKSYKEEGFKHIDVISLSEGRITTGLGTDRQ